MTMLAKLASRAAWMTPDNRLGVALFIAVILHAIIILGVGFGSEPNQTADALDVILVPTATHQAPRDAKYLAHADSQASPNANSRFRSDGPFSYRARSANEAHRRSAIRTESVVARLESLERKLLMQRRADYEAPDDLRQLSETINAVESSGRLDSQIMRLTSELAKDARRYAKRSHVHFLQSVSARSAVEATYVKAWIDRVERVGNVYYPIEAVERELGGRVILHVLLNHEGDIEKAFIGSPSGQPVLDTAALRIVRLAAPFHPFSGDMRKTYDQLMITRTWVFDPDGGLSTR